tara:strand:+ start:7137 stop:10685 length:3549 start_codon:yes stop_codon:yes gene_type:complete
MNAITKGGYQDVPMSRRRAQLLAEYAERLATMLENAPDDKDLAEWVQSKIDRAASAIQSAYHYLDQEDDLEKGAGHKYTHRKRVGTDKRGRARYRYYYQEHHGGGITRAKLEAGSAFKLTFRGRRGHFHIESVQGDIVTVKHDGRPNSKPVEMTKAEFRALIKRQHGQALASHTEKLRRQVDKLKRNPTRKRSTLGLALHRLRQAAEKAGVTLPEEYQRKPKKKTAQTTETPREDRFDTMPEVESTGTSQSKTEFREKIEELKRLEDQQQDFTGALYRPQGLTKEQEKDILDKMQAEIAKKRDELTEGFVRPQSSEELETRLSEFLPTFKGLDYNRIEGYRFYVDREHRASLRARIKDLVGTGLNISPANQKNYGLNVAGTFKDLVRLLFALENEAKEETRSPVQSEVLEAVNQSQAFINDLIFNKQGKLTRARNRNKLKGYSDNGARSVAGDIVSETMREVSPHLMNHTNRQRYENQARVNVARVLSESKGLTREEIAVSIETVLRDTAQKTGVLNPPREMILPKRTGEISEFGERLADRETVEIDVSPTPTTARDQLTTTAQEIITEADQDHDERHDEHQSIEQFELGEHTHTKTGVKLFTAKQKGRTDRDEYRRRVEIAKKHNGRYERRYVKGFLFKTAEDARNFALEVEGGQVEESAETVTPHEDHPQADNFETMPEVESTGTQANIEDLPPEGQRTAEDAKQEAREAQEARQYQKQTFTPEIQTAISYPVYGRGRNSTKKSFESLFKTRKDGGIFRMSKGEDIGNLAYAIAENLPEAVREYKAEIGMEGLSSLIANEIREAIEQRETPAELKDRIGAVITQRAQDNAVRRKEEITGRGERSALREMRRNIMTPSGDGYFDHQGRGGPRSYVGLGAIEKTLDMSERLDDLYVDAIFKQALPPELERFKAPISRFEPKAADQVAVAFANKYETVGEIRDNISTIREQMRATIKSAVDTTADALVKRPNTLDMIKRSHEMITEQHDTQRQEAAEASRALAQYTDDPQAHLAEIQELERQSDQAIAEQMEINREFANAYIHEASDLVERALESTKGEVIDSVMSVKTPKHANKFTASVQGKANRKLIARIFNEVFEQVRREIGDEPIERGEKHPRNIADTVKKPSKTPAQFRDDIERDQEEKKARARAKREARRAQRTQKSALHLTNYRADLYRTIERLAS